MDDLEFEQESIRKLDEMIEAYQPYIEYLWRWGDGDGGHVIQKLKDVFSCTVTTTPIYTKMPIGRSIRKKVMERDMYRCRKCGSHIDLSIDHIIPESSGGEMTEENLQTLCLPCNKKKSTRSNEEFMGLVTNE